VSRRLVVVDTNVVVAGLLTADSGAPTARILDAMLAGHLRFALSLELLAEYREVLLRPAIRARHGLAAGEIDRVLSRIALHGRVIEAPVAGTPAPDPGDQHLWDLLASVEDAVLVTGDAALGDVRGITVMSPSELAREVLDE
jgi:uncharacterized protein